MTEPDPLRDILESIRTVAVVGLSRDPEKPSHFVPKLLLSKGYRIVPIHPKAGELLGRKCYPDLASVEEDVDAVEVFRPASEAPDIVRQAVARREARGDVSVVWLQLGIRNDEAKRIAEENGLTFVEDRCMKQEYERIHGTAGED
jgi:predicted CoA-binding protein